MNFIEIFKDLTPAQKRALVMISKVSYYNVRSEWHARGSASIKNITVLYLEKAGLVEKVRWRNDRSFGYRLKITFNGRMALALIEPVRETG